MVGALYLMIVLYFDVFVTSSKDCPEICLCLGNFVDCSKKNLVAVPPSIPKWTTHLNLNNNQISKLTSDEWTALSKLTEIKLNRNNISSIPIGFFEHQKRIEILELNQNKLKDIDALTFKHLEHVKTLKLKLNRISQLKDGAFFGLAQIKLLLLDYNKIKVISKGWLYGLNSLKRLSLSNNNIDRIETDAWEFCHDLIELDLSFNHMTSIKIDTFKYLKDLEKLVLNNNNIKFIKDDAFAHLPKLQSLQLNHNEIAWTIEDANGVYSGLNSLTKFHLAFNNIKSVNKNAFLGLQNLQLLDLSGNNITSVQKNAFEELSLKSLPLNTTSLLCDCNVKWFVGWVKQKQLELTVKAVCSYPDWVRGVALLEVPDRNFTCDELPKPRLIEQPEPEIMALKGENICLSCKAVSSSPKPMTFQWKKDNKELSNADVSVSMITRDGKSLESNSELNIYKVQHSDAGKYQCVVSNSYGTTYSQKSNISVLIFPTFKKMPTNVTVRAGQTARLECASDGEPLPEIAWQKDGGNDFPAARERRMHVMPTDDVFFIVNAKPSDTGIYSCTAHNAAGTIVANATLLIEELPSFVKPMEDKEVSAGDPVILQCMASGSPKPAIYWLKDGQSINVTERHFLTLEDQLMIITNTKPSDSGIYQCCLKNSLGNVTGLSHVKVKVDVINASDLMGIVIIAVVCCAVATSVCWVVIIYHTRKRIPAPPEPIEFTDKALQFVDNTSESSSCKDSGTGDSAKHSNEDLGPDEFTLIIKETGMANGMQTSRREASLVYSIAEGSSTHTPLLHSSDVRTNHDRVENGVEVKVEAEGVPFADDSDV